MRAAALVFTMVTVSFGADRILVHGHRGARSVLPENTIPAFEHAIQAGADFLELDVAVTKDNVPVVFHDQTINSMICSGPRLNAAIRELTLEEVKAHDCGGKKNPLFQKQRPVPDTRIPTLEEVFALSSKGQFHFNVELKISPKTPDRTPPPEEFTKLVLDTIRKHKLENRVLVQSFDFRILHAMTKLAPAIPLAALYEGPAKDFLEIAKESGAKTVAPQFRLVTKEQVDAAHKAGLKVVPWTVNTEADWKRMIEAGVDAIITDDPTELIAFLKRPRV